MAQLGSKEWIDCRRDGQKAALDGGPDPSVTLTMEAGCYTFRREPGGAVLGQFRFLDEAANFIGGFSQGARGLSMIPEDDHGDATGNAAQAGEVAALAGLDQDNATSYFESGWRTGKQKLDGGTPGVSGYPEAKQNPGPLMEDANNGHA